MSSAAPIASHLAYCRAARRLRSRCADRPSDLYQGLRRLSEKADSEPRATIALSQTPEQLQVEALNASIARASGAMTLTPAAMAFIPIIRKALDGPVLRYSARQRLLSTAGRLGIGRFHANLLIALVQHEMQKRDPGSASAESASPALNRWLPRLVPIAFVLAVECAGAVAIWHALHS